MGGEFRIRQSRGTINSDPNIQFWFQLKIQTKDITICKKRKNTDGINEPEQSNENNVHTILGDHKLKTEGMARATAETEEGLRTACPAPAFNWATRSLERRERQCNSKLPLLSHGSLWWMHSDRIEPTSKFSSGALKCTPMLHYTESQRSNLVARCHSGPLGLRVQVSFTMCT